jgi:hypothetical protein
VIHASQVMPLLLGACPSAQATLDAHDAYWREDKPGVYLDVAAFIHHLIDLVARKQTDEFPAVFAVVERLIASGDDETQTIAVVGLLETLQNNTLNWGWDLDIFLPWLGPRTRVAWVDLIRDWGSVG